MKNLFKNITVGVIAMMMSVGSVFAEVPAGFKASSSMEKFRNDMLSTAKSMTTLRSDFVQTKHISGMTKDIVSSGEFCFKKDDKLSLDYKKPMPSQIIVNGSKIKMRPCISTPFFLSPYPIYIIIHFFSFVNTPVKKFFIFVKFFHLLAKSID